MRKNLMAFVLLAGLTGALTGCIGTADDRSTMGVPFIKDNVLGQYERPSGELFEAAKSVLTTNGKLIAENTINHSLEARVNKIHVWVRVLEVDPKLSRIEVQTRTWAGGSDLELAHDLEKQVALKLVH